MMGLDANATQLTGRDAELVRLTDELTSALEAGKAFDLDAFVAAHSEHEHELRRIFPAIESLVRLNAMHEEPDPAVAITGTAPHHTLGDFRIFRELGRGGMGVVYEAEQISLGRRMALKVLPFAAMLDKQQLKRFKNEARAAATLDHPNIVAVHSVGEERGVHYYAMQLIEGESLAQVIARLRKESGGRGQESVAATIAHQPSPEFLPPVPSPRWGGLGRGDEPGTRDATLSPHSALDTQPVAALSTRPDANHREYFRTIAHLGVQAAEALDHAHQNGILHRDVKPANLMIDDAGKLWITDFGLARIEADAGMTMTGDILGTLRYMSPEQALAKRVVVDHRSDIYSLGVTLYELLTLQPAYAAEDRQELLRQIAFEEPKSPTKRNRHIPNELETIVLKAMRKSPEQRYATAHELADDLRRFLEHIPIKAKPPTWRERIVKLSQRHPAAAWAGVFFVLATMIVSAVSAVVISAAYRREAAARQKAEASDQQAQSNARQAQEISQFLVNAFRSPAPDREGRSVTIAEVLARSARELQTQFTGPPDTKAELLIAIAQAYIGLGLFSDAIPLLEESHRLRQSAFGPYHVKTIRAARFLASTYQDAGHIDDAIKLQEETLSLARAHLGPTSRDTLNVMYLLAIDYQEDQQLKKAISLYEELVKLAEQTLGRDDSDTMMFTGGLAQAYTTIDHASEAIPLLERVYEYNKRELPPTNIGRLADAHNLANAYGNVGRTIEATAILEETLKLRRQVLGPDHPETLNTLNSLAVVYQHAGRRHKSLPLFEEAFSAAKARLGAAHPLTVRFMTNIAGEYETGGRWDEAVALCKQTVELQRSKFGPDHYITQGAMARLAYCYRRAGRPGEAIAMLEDILQLEPRSFNSDDAQKFMCTLAWLFATAPEDQGRDGDRAIELAAQLCQLTDYNNAEYVDVLAAAYAATGDFAAAAKWAKKAIDLSKADDEARKKFSAHLESFQSGQALRGERVD